MLEQTLRARFAYLIAKNNEELDYGKHIFYGKFSSEPELDIDYIIGRVKSEIGQSKEPCILKYKELKKPPPIWVFVEISTFSTLSKMISRYRDGKLISDLGLSFGGYRKIKRFKNCIKAMVNLRNLCAHNQRLWNRAISFEPSVPVELIENLEIKPTHNSVALLLILLCDFVDQIQENNEYSKAVFDLLNSNPTFRDGIFKPRKGKVRCVSAYDNKTMS